MIVISDAFKLTLYQKFVISLVAAVALIFHA